MSHEFTDANDPQRPSERQQGADEPKTRRQLPDEPPPAASQIPHASRIAPGATPGAAAAVHLLFGAVEDLLDDLREHGTPEGNIVRVERIVRTRATEVAGAVATQGVLVTARRADEVLSAWVVVGRLALDPWGQPLDRERAKRQTQRHQETQRVISAQVADAGHAVRTGLYLLPDAGYSFAATSEALAVAISRSDPEAPTAPLTPTIAEPAPCTKSPRAERPHAKDRSSRKPRPAQVRTDDEAGGLPHA